MVTIRSGLFTVKITDVRESPNLRSVFLHLPHVAPPGVDVYTAHGGRHFELTSFKNGPVELYVLNPRDGLYMYQGTVRAYAPGDELRQAFRAAWYKAQPSKAARAAFEASATSRDPGGVSGGRQRRTGRDPSTAATKAYRATFVGRQVGAIGKFHKVVTKVWATSPEAARLKLYEKYEHLQGLKITKAR